VRFEGRGRKVEGNGSEDEDEEGKNSCMTLSKKENIRN
jgi:hypothetical protein